MILDDVRNLDPDELTSTDISVLKEHKEELNEDEKIRYSNFFNDKEVEPITPEVVAAVVEPVIEPIIEPVVEEKFTKNEVQKMIDEAMGRVPKPVVAPKEEEVAPFVAEDWEPKGWGEVFDKAVEYNRIQSAKVSAKVQSDIDAINDTLTSEIDDLRALGEEIPAKGTQEYIKFDNNLTELAMKYKIPSFKLAYGVYKELNKVATVDPVNPVVVPPVNKDNKELARKMGGASKEVSPSKTEVNYATTIRGKTPRQIADSHMDELE